MQIHMDSIGRRYFADSRFLYGAPDVTEADSVKLESMKQTRANVDSLYRTMTLLEKKKILDDAVASVDNMDGDWVFKSFVVSDGDKRIRKHMTEWHNKITLSLACLIFFFIGAPLGAIIRKGGLGMPVVVSVAIFIIYYIINNTGYKMARDGNWLVWQGMWISSFVLAPLGGFITYKSNKDSVAFNADLYMSWLRRLVGIRTKRHIIKKEVIIKDPDYSKIAHEMLALSASCEAFMKNHKLKDAPNYIRIWQRAGQDEEVASLNERLEQLVDELSNSTDGQVLSKLNDYPVISVSAHQSPFHNRWLNVLTGLFLPLGLVFYVRIWMFRIRLYKDMQQIIETNHTIQNLIINIQEDGKN